jgi:hypothetical protein
MSLAVIAQAASTLFLAGVSWTIQVAHYPLFARVGPDGFAAAMADQRSTHHRRDRGALGAAGGHHRVVARTAAHRRPGAADLGRRRCWPRCRSW